MRVETTSFLILLRKIQFHQDHRMADIKLSYFDARGRAELSRLILAYAGVGLYVFLQISLFDILNETAE